MKLYKASAVGAALALAACSGPVEQRYDVVGVDRSVCEVETPVAWSTFAASIRPVGELAANVVLREAARVNDQRNQRLLCEQATKLGQHVLLAYDQQSDPSFVWDRKEEVQQVIITARHRTEVKEMRAVYDLPPNSNKGFARLSDLQVVIGEHGETRTTRIDNFDDGEGGNIWTMVQDRRQGMGLEYRSAQSFGTPDAFAALDQISENTVTAMRDISKAPMPVLQK